MKGFAMIFLLLTLLLPGMVSAQPVRPRIAVVSIHIEALPNDARAAAKRLEESLHIDFYGLGRGLVPSVADAKLASYDLVLLDMGGPRAYHFTAQIQAAMAQTKVLVIGPGTPFTGNIDPTGLPDLAVYWENANTDNYAALFAYVAANVLQQRIAVPPPERFAPLALWHPDAVRPFASVPAYLEWQKSRLTAVDDRPRIGLVFYRSLVLARNDAVIAATIREIEQQGGLPLPIWRKGSTDLASSLLGRTRLDALIVCGNRLNYANAAAGVAEAKRLGVPPLMCATEWSRTPEQWRKETGGMSPGSTGELALSELEGMVEPITVGARAVDADGTARSQPLPQQIHWRVARAMAWARLHRQSNHSKRVVISYHNEEPGKADVGSDPDSYLDAQGSIVALLRRLRDEGYDTGSAPIPDTATLARDMANAGTNVAVGDDASLRERIRQGAITIDAATYADWFASLPAAVRATTEKQWGPPPGRIMTVDGKIVIPALRFGKIVLVAHPIWGLQQDAAALASTAALPPHHQYLAFYLWMQRQEHTDAFLPLFTQLSLMPGKREGPAASDPIALLIGSLPNIMPQPLQANGGVANKRRAEAVTIGFMPELVRAGLSPELSKIAAKLDQSPIDQSAVRDAAAAAGMARTLQLDPLTAPWTTLATAIKHYLQETWAAPMTLGGHVLGKVPDIATITRMVQAMLAGNDQHAPSLAEVSKALAGAGTLDAKTRAQARDYAARIRQAPRELDAIVDALAGRYVEPGPMQDAVRNPDALPAGRNPYTLDIRGIPGPAAWDTGKRLADAMLAQYHSKHGQPPRKVAFILWSGETAQNGGTNEAQILRLLGTRPVWDKRGEVVDVALDSRDALARPRVDVLITTSGTYRDHFAGKIALIAKAIALAADAAEADNPVRQDTEARMQELQRQGVPAADARKQALRRIFSTAPGAYSPTTEFAIKQGWSAQKLNAHYQARLGFAYDDSDGEPDAQAFAANLDHVDAAVFSRSSSTYGVLDTPMPAAYLGGLTMAVREQTGRSIDAFIANGQQSGQERMETLDRFYGRERDSRYLNPDWIRAMKASGYNGARYMAGLAESMLLWDVNKPDLVTDADWNKARDVYIRDQYGLGLKEFFAEVNPAAGQQLAQTMLAAVERNAWHTDKETIRELQAMAGAHPGDGNPALVSGTAPSIAPGAAPPAPAAPAPSQPGPTGGSTAHPVSGYEMISKPQATRDMQESQPRAFPSLLLLALLGLFGIGACWRSRW